MNIYDIARPILFALDPETAHAVTLKTLQFAHNTGILPKLYGQIKKPVNVMGLEFKNRLGLAAGMDKNGDYVDAFGDLGFGFIEIGTVTPRSAIW